jgi:hypothetical protein
VLCWTGLLFAGIQLAAGALFDYCWPQIRFPMFDQLFARLEARTTAPSIVCLGSSRTGCLVQEGELDRTIQTYSGDHDVHCFNAYIGYGDVIVAERVLRRLVAQGSQPRCVLVEVCPESVNHRDSWLTYYVTWFLGWEDVPSYLREMAITNNLVRFAGARAMPLYVYRYQIRQQLTEFAWRCVQGQQAIVQPAVDASAWQQAMTDTPREPGTSASVASTESMDGVYRALRDYRPGGNAAAALERLLQTCRTHGIEPILMTPPLRSDHRACYTAIIETAFDRYVANLSRAYGCRYVDYRTALPDTLFVDHHHVSGEGGRRFSHALGADLLAPQWAHTRSPDGPQADY